MAATNVRMKTFVQELKTRRVYRVAIAYIVAGSAFVQVAGTVLPIFHARDWMQQMVVALVAFGFPVALVLAWVFQLKDGSIKTTRRPPGARSAVNNRQVWFLGAMGAMIALSGLAIYWLWRPWEVRPAMEAGHRANIPEPTVAAIPEKSIAVLPFENLSDDKENVHFTIGVQDEILTNLAKVADLKVISRTSVMQYGSSRAGHNVREIGKTLGVAHILEGSVQRTSGRVRVSAQLIDARTDAHLWAKTYDRELADVFALESELAQSIVSELRTKISPEEKAAIEERPTADLIAYDLYSRAKILIEISVFNASRNENLMKAVRLLDQAVARDPSFILAYYQLAHAHDQIYSVGIDRNPDRLALADAAIQAIRRLRPDSGAAHLALAKHLYWGYRDYDQARGELFAARRALPNDPLTFLFAGYVDRRQGRWNESTRNLEQAAQLDPRNVFILQQLSLSYQRLRRYADAAAILDRALAIASQDVATRVQRAELQLEWHADTKPLHSTIQAVISEDPTRAEGVAEQWMYVGLCERDHAAVTGALTLSTAEGCWDEGLPFPRAWCEGWVAYLRGDAAAEQGAFAAARAETEKLLQDQPLYAEALCVLGVIDARLGRKEDAIREGRRAVELLPLEKDSINGALAIQYLAMIYAWTNEKDLAFGQLTQATQIPGDLSYGQLRLHPYWDPLRGDPRFEKLVESLAPK